MYRGHQCSSVTVLATEVFDILLLQGGEYAFLPCSMRTGWQASVSQPASPASQAATQALNRGWCGPVVAHQQGYYLTAIQLVQLRSTAGH